MITKNSIIDQIEILRNGTLQIRFGLLLIEDGKEIDCKWHRTTIEPGGDVDGQIASVNTNLTAMGKVQVEPIGIARVKKIATVVHTPEVIRAYQDAQKLSMLK